jgi:hypothetical protein
MSLPQQAMQKDETPDVVTSRLTPHLVIRYKTDIWYLGKRGVNPPLPRNCERGERERAEMQPLGFPGKAVRGSSKRKSGDRPDANPGLIQLRWESWKAFLSVPAKPHSKRLY